MPDYPTGEVAFLFTDIEGSTRLWGEHPQTMGDAVARHDVIVKDAIENNGGYVFSTAGDSFSAAFSSAREAIAAAVEGQLGVSAEDWGRTPVRVRMAVNTGEAEERDADYFGPVVNETARLVAAANGGQILASSQVAGVLRTDLPHGLGLVDLGKHRLKDVASADRVYQVVHPDLPNEFPPLRSVRRNSVRLAVATVAVVLGVLGGGLALSFLGSDEPVVSSPTDPPTTTKLPRIEDTKITEELPEFFGNTWETFGGNQARTGATDATGVREPAGYYWRFGDTHTEFIASPIVLGQNVVIGGLDGRVYFLEQRTGGELPRVSSTQGAIRVSAAGSTDSDEHLALVLSRDGFLYAYDLFSGSELWTYQIDTCCTPAFDGARIYVGDTDGFLHAVAPSGTLIWKHPSQQTGFGGPITTDITFADGKLYFGVRDLLWQLDVENEEAIECRVASGDFLTPVVSNGMIYAASTVGIIQVLEADTCTWARNILVGEQLSTMPAVKNGMLYQAHRFGVIASTVDGQLVWTGPKRDGETLSRLVQGSPTVAAGLVYFGAQDGHVYAVDALTGNIVWTWDAGAPIVNSIAVTDRALYVATKGGDVTAIAPVAAERIGETTLTTAD